jgi:thioredoxin 1
MQDISQEYDVNAMPTFVFILNGKPVEKLVGANKGELEKKVQHFASRTA